MSAGQVAGIVLAGGRSTRFGGDKLVADVAGRPLLHLAIGALARVVDEIVVVVGPNAPEPPLPAGLHVPVVIAHDAAPGLGPLAGLAAGLAVASHPLALLVGGDQPALQPALLRELARRLHEEGGAPLDLVGLAEDGHVRPLPVALRTSTTRPAADAALAEGTRSLVGLFERLRVATLRPEEWRVFDPGGDSLRDVDTLADLPPA